MPAHKVPSPGDIGLPERIAQWRPGQEEALHLLQTSEERFVALCAPTGFGKSGVVVADALMSGEPAAIVTNSRGLQDQYLSIFKECGMVDLRGRSNYQCQCKPDDPDYTCEDGYAASCPYKGSVACPSSQAEMRAGTSNLVVTNYAKWTYSKKMGMGLDHIKRVYFDEAHNCFPAGTKIRRFDNVRRLHDISIEDIKVGDEVVTFREHDSAYLPVRRVKTVMITPASKLLKINFSDGTNLICTPAHPLYTESGYLPASSVVSFMLCLKHGKFNSSLCQLRLPYRIDSAAGVRLQEVQESLLFPVLSLPKDIQGERGDRYAKGIQTETNAGQQPDVQQRDSDESQHPITWNFPKDTPWERYRSHSTTEETRGGFRTGDGGYRFSREMATWISQVLQARPWGSEPEVWDRDRWEESQKQESIGPEEGYGAYWVGVDSVEVYESADRQRFLELCPGGQVFNLEVEDTHSYIANDLVVHNCPSAIAQAMQVTLHAKECEEELRCPFPRGADADDMREWRSWAVVAKAAAEVAMAAAQARITGVNDPKRSWIKKFTHYRNLVRRLAILQTARPNEWVVEQVEKGYQFDPVKPGRYAESTLFLRVPKVVMVSATLRPKTLFMCWVAKDNFVFKEFDSDFDPHRCPIYYVPTMRVDRRASDLGPLWAMLDRVMSKRRDRKGIIHTVSYARQEDIHQSSRFFQSMIINPKGSPATETVDLFKQSGPGTVLVSPSVGEGYDFPDDECRWQFMCKIPFEPPSKIVKAREAEDKEYRAYQAVQQLVQAFGRGMRSKTDWCENVIGDEHLDWFLPRYSHLAPRSFHSFYKRSQFLPQPLHL